MTGDWLASQDQEYRPHIVVVNRWGERYAEYERYVDHERHQVTYVTTVVGLGAVPASAAGKVVVDATDDLGAVRAAVRTLVTRHGVPIGLIALKEDDLLVGAQLRVEWGCPGPRPHDLRAFRDKGVMCEAIRRAGLAVPAFGAASDELAVSEFAASYGWPLIVKPRVGSSSEGVIRLEGPADLGKVPYDGDPLLVQQYCADPIYHIDGVFDGREIPLWRCARYLNSCLGFRTGSVLGSVEVDDPVRHRVLGESASEFLRALTDKPTVFHLEVFVGGTDESPVCTFLEVGARTGGAEIPFLWREVHGYDLVEAAARLQLGLPVPPLPPVPPRQNDVAGFLLVPAPATRPCRIIDVTPMVGQEPGPYAESLLKPGQIIPAADSYYEHVGGRFRFRGASSADVERSISATARHFRVTAEPVKVARATAKDYSVPVLDGPGDTDYERYMRTDVLLSLQRRPHEVVHRDELLFQTVHQTTELWLKHACFEVEEATALLQAGSLDSAARLLARASLGVDLITDQLEMLRHLTPWAFQTVRTVLGHGSGFESPGWRSVKAVSRDLGTAFDTLLLEQAIDLLEVYRGSPDVPLYRLAEGMIEWDERISVWRVRHFKIATRIIGHDVVGTKGTPVEVLARLISHKLYPALWQIRTQLTETGPMGADQPVNHESPLMEAAAMSGCPA